MSAKLPIHLAGAHLLPKTIIIQCSHTVDWDPTLSAMCYQTTTSSYFSGDYAN